MGAEDGYIWQEGDGAATASNANAAESSSSASPAEHGYVWQQGGATGNSSAPSESTDSGTAAPFGGLFNDLGISMSSSQESSSGTSTTSTTAASDVSTSGEVKKGLHKGERQPGETPQFSKFPVLREGDGDRAVHTLHVRYLHQQSCMNSPCTPLHAGLAPRSTDRHALMCGNLCVPLCVYSIHSADAVMHD